MAAWVAVGDPVAGLGVAPGAEEAAVVAVEVDPTVAWVAAMVTGSVPTRRVGTTTSRGGCSATGARHPVTVRVGLVGPTAPEADPPGCGVACVVGPGVAAEATGAVPAEGAPWVGAAEAVAPWAVAEEDHPWAVVGAALEPAAVVPAVEVPCGAVPEGTEETGEHGPTRCPGKRRPPFVLRHLLPLTSLPSCSSPSHNAHEQRLF